MKHFRVIVILIAIFFVQGIGLGFLEKQSRRILKYLGETEKKYLEEISVCNIKLNDCLAREKGCIESLELSDKFESERCVCVWWSTNMDEEPMTKDEICNYPLPMGSYSPEHGYSRLRHWQPEKEIK